MLLYRESSGTVVALEDRCAHRALPLSLGSLVDDRVVCRYHGFAYDGTGACVDVPSQEHVPYGAQVASYPCARTARSSGSGWATRAAPQRHRRRGCRGWRDPSWTALGGERTVAAGYMLLHENALDRTHFAFVHPDTAHRGYLDRSLRCRWRCRRPPSPMPATSPRGRSRRGRAG